MKKSRPRSPHRRTADEQQDSGRAQEAMRSAGPVERKQVPKPARSS